MRVTPFTGFYIPKQLQRYLFAFKLRDVQFGHPWRAQVNCPGTSVPAVDRLVAKPVSGMSWLPAPGGTHPGHVGADNAKAISWSECKSINTGFLNWKEVASGRYTLQWATRSLQSHYKHKANSLFTEKHMRVSTKYSDTSANEDNSFRNHIR